MADLYHSWRYDQSVDLFFDESIHLWKICSIHLLSSAVYGGALMLAVWATCHRPIWQHSRRLMMMEWTIHTAT